MEEVRRRRGWEGWKAQEVTEEVWERRTVWRVIVREVGVVGGGGGDDVVVSVVVVVVVVVPGITILLSSNVLSPLPPSPSLPPPFPPSPSSSSSNLQSLTFVSWLALARSPPVTLKLRSRTQSS